MNPFIYVLIAGLAVGFGGGYHVRSLQADADQAEAVQKAIKFANDNAEITRAEDLALIKSQQKTKVVYKTITKEVPKYVPVIQKTDSECNLSIGTVRLLNSAALERMSEAAGIDDSDNSRSSTVTESRLIDYSVDVIDQYNQVKNQCNALIRWHNKTQIKDK